MNRHAGAISMIIGPLLFGLSTFFWKGDEYGVTGGTILSLSLVFWMHSFIVLFDKIQEEMPYYSSIGLLLAIYGCAGGMNFGTIGFFAEAFGLSHETYIAKLEQYPVSSNLLLFWSGPLFPISVLVLSTVLILKKKISLWTGLSLAAGAVLFPVSRIVRIEVLAHLCDALLALPMIAMGVRNLRKNSYE